MFGNYWLGRRALYLALTVQCVAVLAAGGYAPYRSGALSWWVTAAQLGGFAALSLVYLYASFVFPFLARRRVCCFQIREHAHCFYRLRRLRPPLPPLPLLRSSKLRDASLPSRQLSQILPECPEKDKFARARRHATVPCVGPDR